MEQRQDSVAFGSGTFATLCAAFEAGKWISYEFPDLILRLELDRSIEGDGIIHRHEGRRMETQRLNVAAQLKRQLVHFMKRSLACILR